MKDPVRVIYIMGAARSGTTVLNTLLDNHPECTGVGELMKLTRSDPDVVEYCSCGELGDRCEFWADVMAGWVSTCGIERRHRYPLLQDKFERARRWPTLIRARRRPGSRFNDYAELTAHLYRSIARVANKPIIADSSKYPARGFGLSCVSGVDVRIIHIVRDPRGVAWSLKKSFAKDLRAGIQRDLPAQPAFKSALLWLSANLQAEYVMSRLEVGRCIRVRYEDLVSRPETVVESIETLAELDRSGSWARPDHGALRQMRHAIAGNRVRMLKEIQLQADLDWQTLLPTRDRRMVEMLTSPLLKRYGYQEAPVA